MKRWNMIFAGLILLTAACTKNDKITGTASLMLFNAVKGSNQLVVNFNGPKPVEWFASAGKLYYGVINEQYNGYAGKQPLSLYEYPDTTSHDRPVFDLTLDIPVGTINSLFLTGSLASPDTLLTRDFPPVHAIADSTMGVRFINIAPGNKRFSVNLQGAAYGSEAASLGYKNVTPFKHYKVKQENQQYVYELRDASDGTLLHTFTVNTSDIGEGANKSNAKRNRNFTLLIYGDPAGTGPDQLAIQFLENY